MQTTSIQQTSLVSRDPDSLRRLLAPAGVTALIERKGEIGLGEVTVLRVGDSVAFSARFENSILIEQAAEGLATYLTADGGLALELTPPSRTLMIEGAGVLFAPVERARFALKASAVVQGLVTPAALMRAHVQTWFPDRDPSPFHEGVTRYGRAQSGAVNRFLGFMLREAAFSPSAESAIALDRQFSALMDLIIDKSATQAEEPAEWNVAPRHLKRAEDYVRANLDKDLTMTDVALAAGVSPRSLHRAFLDFRGIRFSKFVRDARIDAACVLIRDEPALPLKAAAARVGYADYTSFWRHYRARFGVSPRGGEQAVAA